MRKGVTWMIPPPAPANENARLKALVRLQLLDTPREELFDTCVKVAAAALGASRGAISLVDSERQWFKAIFGDLPPETARDISFCGHTIVHDDVLIIRDTSDDPRFHDNPLVTDGGIAFYAGFPLRSHEGLALGTLCLIHDEPLEVSEEQLAMLAALCECIQTHLDLRLLALQLGKFGLEGQQEREILEDLERKRGDVVAMGVHDISNPLTVAMGTAELLLHRPSLSPETREAVEAIASATETAARLLSDLMSVAQSKSTELRATFQRVDVRAIALALARRLRLLVARHAQEIEVVDLSSTATIVADGLLVERTIRNLLDNAMKYAGPGRITLHLSDHGPDELEIAVIDRGPAVPLELRERIFEPGFRATDASTRSGHGLGLAFCRQAVELHGGTIQVRAPDRGAGNSFVVTLPRSPALARPPGRAPLPPSPP